MHFSIVTSNHFITLLAPIGLLFVSTITLVAKMLPVTFSHFSDNLSAGGFQEFLCRFRVPLFPFFFLLFSTFHFLCHLWEMLLLSWSSF